MTFNLLTDPFMPVRTRDGGTRILTLTELPFAEDALEPDWPRPDFNAAAMELMIGIAALALQPQDADAWIDVWEQGPERWEERLCKIAPAFELLGNGPRFLQENGGLTGDSVPIEALLIDTPGANGQKKNTDLLTHRDRYPQLGLPASAMAIYTLQAYAPAGGAGNQTSMRGGGPLTTLVIPQGNEAVSLWRKIWANVPLCSSVDDISRVCPWMRPGVTPGKISQGHGSFHDLHVFFGMPRRLWLIEAQGRCAMTGSQGPVISGFVQKPHGHDYGVWQHPLTPYKRQKEDGEPYTAKPSSARFRAADWILAALGDPPLRQPASMMSEARSYRVRYLKSRHDEPAPRLRVSGWNMNNMEATDWLGAEEPLYVSDDPELNAALDRIARTLAASGSEAASLAALRAKIALFGDASIKTDKGVLDEVRTAVLDSCDARFHEWMGRASAGTPASVLLQSWRVHLRQAALDAFDRAAPVPLMDPERAPRVLSARQALERAFADKTKSKALKELIVEVSG